MGHAWPALHLTAHTQKQAKHTLPLPHKYRSPPALHPPPQTVNYGGTLASGDEFKMVRMGTAQPGCAVLGMSRLAHALCQRAHADMQTFQFPPLCSTTQVNVYFTVTASVDAPLVASWSTLTGGAFSSLTPLTPANGAVRCGVVMGAKGVNSPVQPDTTGFNAYVFFNSNGMQMQTDQLPIVNNFDNTVNIW